MLWTMRPYGSPQPLEKSVAVHAGKLISLPDVTLRNQNYEPVHAIAWWEQGYDEPIYLLTNIAELTDACHWYRKRAQIETFFSAQKSRGFHLHKSHLSAPTRLSRLMIAACLAYLWIIHLGVLAWRDEWRKVIHCTTRCALPFSVRATLARAFPQYWV